MQKRQRRQGQKRWRTLEEKINENKTRRILELADSLMTRENERKRLVRTGEYDFFAQDLYEESMKKFLKALKDAGLSKDLSFKEKEKILEEARKWMRKGSRH